MADLPAIVATARDHLYNVRDIPEDSRPSIEDALEAICTPPNEVNIRIAIRYLVGLQRIARRPPGVT
jgi:hypothetical protein